MTRGPVFCIHTYLSKAETEKQRGLAIQEGLKYEEEYLSYKIKLRAVKAQKDKQKKPSNGQQDPSYYNSDSNFASGGRREDQASYLDQEEQSYMSDTNYQMYGLDSVKIPTAMLLQKDQKPAEISYASFLKQEPPPSVKSEGTTPRDPVP